jgi:hypothetical protein
MSNIFGGAVDFKNKVIVSIIIIAILIFSLLVITGIIKISTFQNKSIIDISQKKNKMMMT